MAQRKLKKLQIEDQIIHTDYSFVDKLEQELDAILCAAKLLDYEIYFYQSSSEDIEVDNKKRMEYEFSKDIGKIVFLVFKLSGDKNVIDELSIELRRNKKRILNMSIKPLHAENLEIDDFFKTLKNAVLGD